MKGKNASVAGTMTFTQDSNNPIDTGYAYSNALLGVLDQYTESSNRFPMYEFNTTRRMVSAGHLEGIPAT